MEEKGHLIMSKKERERMGVMRRIRRGDLMISEATKILSLSYRHTRRVYRRYYEEGDKGLIHRTRGKRSNRAIGIEVRGKIIERYRERYNGFGSTFATEKLLLDGYKIDHETLRRWLISEGLWERRRKRKAHRQWRERKEHFGELVQMDGSFHKWFGEDEEETCLLNMVDDASGKTLSLFDKEETIKVAMLSLWEWIKRYGIPKALYVDNRNAYISNREPTIEEELKGEKPLTHFGKACKKLGIQIIAAGSPQAKGRVERSNGVHQDRLVKELHLEKIKDMNRANKFLMDKYLDEINKKFAIKPKSLVDFHRSVPAGMDLRKIFCIEELRRVNNDWTVCYKNRYFQILKDNKLLPRPNDKIIMSEHLDGSIHITYKGEELKSKELISRPVKQMSTNVITDKPKTKYKPGPDHPWRKFSLGRKNKYKYLYDATIPPRGYCPGFYYEDNSNNMGHF